MEATDHSVFSIITAFTSGLDVFKKLKERRKLKKSKANQAIQRKERDLERSLRRGQVEIHDEYNRHAQVAGQKFVHGDAKAHGALSSTLLKLNAGLVAIIQSFLFNDKQDVVPNYKSLTDLSETSRVEALDALGQLYQRISRSTLSLPLRLACRNCGSTKHDYCSRTGRTQHPARRKIEPDEIRTKHISKKSHSGSSEIQVIKITENRPQTQLALVRPRTRRGSSSTSASKGSSPRTSSSLSTATTTPMSSPLPSPAYPKSYLFPPQQVKSPGNASKLQLPTVAPPMQLQMKSPVQSPMWPPVQPLVQSPVQRSVQPSPQPSVTEAAQQPHRRKRSYTVSPPNTPPILEDEVAMHVLTSRLDLVVPRRQNRHTPSVVSHSSGSTKLGEIPMTKWATPFDYEEAARINAEWQPTFPVEEKEKGKSKFFRFWRRGENSS